MTGLARTRRSGQALVEFALVLSIFVLLTMGIVDFGRAVFFYNMLSNAAREGAREGIISSHTVEQICAAALAPVDAPGVDHGATCSTSGSPAMTGAGTLTIRVWAGSAPTTSTAPGTPDRVQLDYTFTPITPIISAVVGSSLDLQASASMYVEP